MDNIGRILMTISCRDCDSIPKVDRAGSIAVADGATFQIMHNGLKVVAGGYYGDWMAHIIRSLDGHHEPQEELIFDHLLKRARHNSLMIELGSFWSYYTMWYLAVVPGSVGICVEPDEANLLVGRRNMELNGLEGQVSFVKACVGGNACDVVHIGETVRTAAKLPCLDMNAVWQLAQQQFIELLHIDTQGAEFEFLKSMDPATVGKQLRFLVVSTHHSSISGSAATHQDCLAVVRSLGGQILVEHSVQESFSGDGLIVASFLKTDSEYPVPTISRNLHSRSMFPVP